MDQPSIKIKQVEETICTNFLFLPQDVQIKIAEKLLRYAKRESIFILTEENKEGLIRTYRINTIDGIHQFFKSIGVPNPSKSNIYKWVQGNRKTMYGYTLKIEKESIKDGL